MAPDPTPTKPTIETSDEFDVFVGAAFTLLGHQFTIEPQELDAIRNTSFVVDVPENEERDVGTFVEFYDALDNKLGKGKLPDLEWEGLKPPLSNLITGRVTLRQFYLKVEKADVKRLVLDVTLATDWKPDGIDFELDSVRIKVEYEPK